EGAVDVSRPDPAQSADADLPPDPRVDLRPECPGRGRGHQRQAAAARRPDRNRGCRLRRRTAGVHARGSARRRGALMARTPATRAPTARSGTPPHEVDAGSPEGRLPSTLAKIAWVAPMAAAQLIICVGFWPGHMSADTLPQIAEASGEIPVNDQHAALLVWLWSLVWPVVTPGIVLALQVPTFLLR